MSEKLKTGYGMSYPGSGDEILITGIAGYFPGCESIAEFEENLFNKVNLANDKPRWNTCESETPRYLGKISKLENFDASFFGIDSANAHTMDPMHRLLLERAYEAIIDAGMNPIEFRNTKMGVFTGCCFYESEKSLLYDKVDYSESGLIGCTQSNLAIRIAQWLQVSGPAYRIDSACSSATYAFDHAFKAIRSGQCDSALVCGVNVSLHPYMSALFNRMGMLSRDGKCKSFDASANGYTRSECVVVCLLQKAKDSRRVYAEVVYTKTNCDGFKENGITYPSGESQQRLLEDFYEECDIPPTTVEFIEAHGTGTNVGDPEELNAIDKVLCKNRTGPLLIGSVKSNMGHSEGASGVCSAIKICIAYHSGYIPPNLHYNIPRKEIPALTQGRLKVVTEKQPWNRGLACFSGFGFGGANGHVLLRNFNKKKVNSGTPTDNLPRLVCVSGRTKSAVERILNSLEGKPLDVEEIRLWHAIHENNIEGHKFRGFAVLKSTLSGTVTIAHDVIRYRYTDRPTCFVYSNAWSQLENVKELMDLPPFASAICKCDAVLKTYSINLIDIIGATSSANINSLHLYVITVAIHIALTDVIGSIGIIPDSVLGYGIGELGSEYAKGIITAEEAINKAYTLGIVPTEKSAVNEQMRCSQTDKDIALLIAKNVIVIQITPKLNIEHSIKNYVKNNIELNVTEKDTEYTVQNFLRSLGRLYEAGVNLKIAKLYPHVQFPVSQTTPLLSHLVEWDHRELWFTDNFHNEQSKFTAVERVVKISMDNEGFDYLLGHCVQGHAMYPGTGYLLLVWETFAMMHKSAYYEFSVVFENIRFLRMTTVPKKGDLEFHITIHPVCGEFEVTENNDAVATGVIRVHRKKNTGESFDNQPSLEQYNDFEKIKISKEDFYKELTLRGYNYSDLFKGVLDVTIDGSRGRVAWNGNWVVYMDYVLQTTAFTLDTRNLFLPTMLQKLIIDTDLHYKTLSKTAFGTNQPFLYVYTDKDTQVTRSGGLEFRGLSTSMASKKPDLNIPQILKYDFVPNYRRRVVSMEETIQCFVDIVIENTQLNKFKAIEVVDEEYKLKNYQPLIQHIDEAIKIIPQVYPELAIMNNNRNEDNQIKSLEFPLHISQLTKTPQNKSVVLFIGANLSKREQVLKDANLCMCDEGYIMSREEDDTSIMKLNNEFDIIALNNTGDEILVLFKKKVNRQNKIFIKIDTLDLSFSWIPKLKEEIEQSNKVVLYSCDDISGIVGLVKCLRKEPGGINIQCLLVSDVDEDSFDFKSPFYQIQLDKNLPINILKDNQWGTYRCITMKNIDVIDSLQHAYLNIETIGDLSTIKWFEGSLRETTEGEDDGKNIFVHVYCSALNFRDIVIATGRVSLNAMAVGRLLQDCMQGSEFSGRLKNGVRVAGISTKTTANVLLCDKYFTIPIPDEWSLEEAASVPIAYLTVYMAFDLMGKMKAGESVLIHAGSGAVGQAAINIALRRGCKVFTTVGTLEKRNFIKRIYPQLEDNQIGNSRDTSFEQMIMEQTNGRGVDLVLNSLSDDMLLASIRCLGRKGRFLEVGKYDAFKNTPIEMIFHEQEISFHGVMLDYLYESTNICKILFESLIKGIAKGEVRPIPSCTFDKQQVESAYRYMAGSRHTGKVIIKIRNEEKHKFTIPEHVSIEGHRRYTCHKDNVYIIVGGLGGFGLELADWLLIRGARKLVLVSSRGISTGYQARRVGIWTSYGADIRILMDDVSTESGCKKILESAVAMGHVEAVFNLAVSLNDALFQDQTPEMFLRTIKPKALATFYLDKLSRNMCPSLRDFVVFSSMVSGRGNSAQTNYGLANSIIERICDKRRKFGLPGLAIQWGAIEEVGTLTNIRSGTGYTEVYGTTPQKVSSCLQALDKVLTQNNAIVSIYVAGKKTVAGNNKISAAESVAQILGLKNLKGVSHQVPLAELGMDSITALEIKRTLESDFNIALSVQDVKTITFAKLMSQDKKDQESNSNLTKSLCPEPAQDKENWVLDLRHIFRNFGEEENAYKPYIFMQTRCLSNSMNTHNTSIKTLFMIPGFDGCANNLETLSRLQNINACVLNFPLDNPPSNLQDMVDRLYKTIKPLKSQTNSFNLLGYSYGTLPLIALAAKLEAEGHIGTIFCVDGSPTWTNILFKNTVNTSGDASLQDTILTYTLEAILPNNSSVTSLVKDASELSEYDDKIDYIIDHLPINDKYSRQFIKEVGKACIYRFKIGEEFNNNAIKKIKSPIVLLRPEHGTIQNFVENYELDKFTEGDVKVHYLKGNHVTILEDPNCATIIEKYLNNN